MSIADVIENWSGALLVGFIGCLVGRPIGRAIGNALINRLEATARALAASKIDGSHQ
ncbi:MAG TPA: hypothetical protein VHZ99_04065 [Steroidobacteraceae bacterium]|jgi:hypothetical protein|nr:hypothetical protein [Steroidobacteraceae bacterium]